MKKYFLLEDGKKQGPYDVYGLKDIGIKPTTPICTTEVADWYNAEDFPELLHILEENPVKKFDYEKDRVFGYKLANYSDRRSGHFRRKILFLPFSILIVALFFVLRLEPKKDVFDLYLFLLSGLILYSSFTMYSIMKYSSAYGGESSKLKLISAVDGKLIHEIAKKDFNHALNITLKYTFLPDFGDYTDPKKIQTFPERIARVYLVKYEGRGNNPA
ncbi:MAG: DUF4339 domain-containing protein [Bacteroidetes bacterium]|nr:DUF4339 domain-containing protein [Bacteroidota bacterium]